MPDPAATAAVDADSAASETDPAAARMAARLAAFRREQAVVDYANRGVSVPEIAARLCVPEAEARRRLRAALARSLPETPEIFAALQMSRLNEALLAAFSAMTEMGLKAVDRVLKILRALDRHHAAVRQLALAAAGEAEPAGSAASPTPNAAAPRERNPMAAQPPENAQNRSQTPAASPADLLARAVQRGGGASATGAARPLSCDGPRDRGKGLGRKAGDDEMRQEPAQPVEKARFAPDFAEPDRCRAGGLLDPEAAAAELLAALGLGPILARALAAEGA